MYVHVAWVSITLSGALVACSPTSSTGGGTAPRQPDAGEAGARLFENCVPCHQQDARGVPGVYPSLVGSPVLLGDTAELSRWVIEGKRPPALAAGRYPTVMTRFGWMKPADAATLLTYLRTHFGNAAPPVDAAAVARALEP